MPSTPGNSGDDDWHCVTTLLLCQLNRLTDWERDWLTRLRRQDTITARQRAVLAAIERAVIGGPELPPNTTAAVVDGVPGLVHHGPMLPNGRSARPRFTPARSLPRSIQQLVLDMLGKGRA
jgi:hypothetical protein